MMKSVSIALAVAGVWLAGNLTGAEVEGSLKPHLREAYMDIKPVFRGERFGNIVVSMKGTVIATWGTSHVRAKLN